MFKTIKFKNFKSWQDTGNISFANITGFFGNNSSGKSSIIQFFLLLKQTVESSDRQRVLNTGEQKKSEYNLLNYELKSEVYKIISSTDKYLTLPPPLKHYGFPNQPVNYFQNADFLPFFTLAYEQAFEKLYYLGPLKEYPKRIYSWAGEKPQDVGRRGELAIIIDTNVLIAANGRDCPQVTSECKLRTGQYLREIQINGTIVIDNQWIILNEYKNKVNQDGQPGIGDAFLKWVLTNQANSP